MKTQFFSRRLPVMRHDGLERQAPQELRLARAHRAQPGTRRETSRVLMWIYSGYIMVDGSTINYCGYILLIVFI